MRPFIALLAGVLFGIGLLLAGMTNPAKVLGFLDLAGQWDPSLAFVMLGAIAVAFLPFRWAGKRSQSLLGAPMQLPTNRTLDKRLIGGSLLFGFGWGIAGLCPGPSVALLLTLQWQPLVFVLSMLAGMLIFQALENRSKR
ncbi:membrane protein [Pseudomonas cichorii]|nr:YeeE/YedE family protein [Pseudomonas cichorii]GFM71400.1 membrane protein [Pseudomonas cichorii]